MKKNVLSFCGLFLLSASVFAQDKSKDFWKEKPVLHAVPAEFAGESSVIIEENTSIVYKEMANNDEWMYKTTHRIAKILDEKGIEQFNKMTVPLYSGQTLETVRARTILANGSVVEVSKDKMKETKNEDSSMEIAFAMDGVEKNAEVELLVCYKRAASWFGKETYQFSVPVVHATFELSSPTRLKFEEKGYNGFPTINDTIVGNERYIYAVYDNVPALHEEAYSFYDANRSRAEYKLSYLPEEKQGVRMFTWQDLVKKMYSNIYDVTERESKAVEKYLSSIGVTQNENEDEKIKKIESALKTNITVYKELNDDDAWKLDNVIAKKSATENSLIRLFAICFLKAGVKHELGTTTNRGLSTFDADFENWNILESYLFYFPDQKKFLSPASVYYRYPFTATDVIGGKGIFCKLTTLGDITSGIADIRSIPAAPVTDSHNDIAANISFTSDMEATADVNYTFSGYCAMGLREAAVLLPKDKIKDMVKSIVGLAEKPENLITYTITGEAFDNYYNNVPLELKAKVKAPGLVEKAGPKYLFKIGDVIGRQSELYQTTERKQKIDLEYPHYLNRTITVNIPEGYKVLNPETINIHADYKDENGNVTTAFYSDYKIDGNKLIVNISEFYAQLHFPTSAFEQFRKVINASADFNKVTLLLAKQ